MAARRIRFTDYRNKYSAAGDAFRNLSETGDVARPRLSGRGKRASNGRARIQLSIVRSNQMTFIVIEQHLLAAR
jgi:hypothetical protein